MNATVRFGRFEFRPATRRLLADDVAINVGARAFDVLQVLISRRDRIVAKDELLELVWPGLEVEENNLHAQVSLLRKLLGANAIKTIPGRGYQFVADVDAEPVPAAAARAPVSIAVLPFTSLGPGTADDYLLDGLTELMIASLAQDSSMRVIARTSSMAYKRSPKRVRDIAAELGVDHIVEGSLGREGNRIQVVVQLVHARTETHQWAQTYTREFRHLLPLLGEIAREVSAAVCGRLTAAESPRFTDPLALSDEALESYLRGRYFWAQRTTQSLHRASEAFSACVAASPDFAPAYGGLVDCQVVLALYGCEPPLGAAALADRHLARALALGGDSAEVQAASGSVRLFFHWDLPGAEQNYLRALSLNPSYTKTYLAYGDLCIMRGGFEEGLRLIHEAVRLSPFDLGLSMNVGDFLIFSARFDEAARQLERTLEREPRFVPARWRFAEALAFAGLGQAARSQVRQILEASAPAPRPCEQLPFIQALTGDHREARKELQRLESERQRRYVSAWPIARTYAVMGDADNAIRWMQVAFDERTPMMLFAGVHAAFDPIRGDPRFEAMLRHEGIPSPDVRKARA